MNVPESSFSLLLTRLERIEISLNGLADVRQILKQIEDNTRAEENKSSFRQTIDEKVTVEIRTSIISVGDIDTVAQQFKCDFFISATWQEPQLQGKSTLEVRCIVRYHERHHVVLHNASNLKRKGRLQAVNQELEIDWKNEWHPRIVFFNAIEIDNMEKNHYFFYEDGNAIPFVIETYRIKGSFRENLELWDFPMDYQELTITLMSDWTNKMVEFQKDMRKADTIRPETFTAVQEWTLCNYVVTESTSTVKTEGSSANDYPLYHIKCYVKRKNGYYLWNIAMIIFLIDILSFSSFSVDASSPADRLSVTLTLLLTAVAFKFVVSQSLPTISYLTLLDKYVLSGLVFLCLMAIENAIAAVISGREAQRLFDQISFYCGVGLFGSIHIVAIITLFLKGRATNQALKKNADFYMERQLQIKQRVKTIETERPQDEAASVQDRVTVVQSADINPNCTASV